MNDSEVLIKLIENGLAEAKEYLLKFGEFFPFGGLLDNDGIYQPVSFYDDTENPSSDEIYENLKSALLNKSNDGETKAFVICRNVSLIPPNSESRTDAIEFVSNISEVEYDSCYVPYRMMSKENIEYYDMFQY